MAITTKKKKSNTFSQSRPIDDSEATATDDSDDLEELDTSSAFHNSKGNITQKQLESSREMYSISEISEPKKLIQGIEIAEMVRAPQSSIESQYEARRRQKRESERRSRTRRLEMIHQLKTRIDSLSSSISEMEKEIENVKDEVFLLKRALHSCTHSKDDPLKQNELSSSQ